MTSEFQLPPPVDEAHNDYWGIPSNPLSIFHTGPAWPLPTGPEYKRFPKETRPVAGHAIEPVWRSLGEKIWNYLDSIEVMWTSIDPVHFTTAGEEPGPVFLWIGVWPSTLTRSRAIQVAGVCLEILSSYAINDIDIAFRESIVTRSAGPCLLGNVSSDINSVQANDFAAHVPFTPSLSLHIAPKKYPYMESNICLYLCKGGADGPLFALATRHGAFPPQHHSNDLYHRNNNSMPRHEILHHGQESFQKGLARIQGEIGRRDAMIEDFKKDLEGCGEAVDGEDTTITTLRGVHMYNVTTTKSSKTVLEKLHADVTKNWHVESQRVLGHVHYAPPISVVGTDNDRRTEDWSLIELDSKKIDRNHFRGNAMYIGTFWFAY